VATLAAAAVVALAAAGVLLIGKGPGGEPTPDQIQAARASAEAKLAFALIADATQRAEDELIDGVLKERVLATAVRGLSRSFRFAVGDADVSATQIHQEPTPKGGEVS
jgi:hypothetical protein